MALTQTDPKTLHYQQYENTTFALQFLDFQLRSFIDSKPVKLGESYIPLKFTPFAIKQGGLGNFKGI